MARNKTKNLPEFSSLNDLVDFFDKNDLGEYWENLPEARFNIALKRRRHLVALDEKVASRLSEIARAKKVSSEKLLNSWLREKLSKVG